MAVNYAIIIFYNYFKNIKYDTSVPPPLRDKKPLTINKVVNSVVVGITVNII